jgi:transcriptional antiterminator NusG
MGDRQDRGIYLMPQTGPNWHVAYVEPRLDRQACSDIADDLGFEVYVPTERLWHNVRGCRIIVQRPLFPRYIFVGVDPWTQGWQELLDVRGVIDVLGRPALDEPDRLPSQIPLKWIEAMRKAERCGVFDRTKVEPDIFKIGETVKISEGPLMGYIGLIQQFIAQRRRARSPRKQARILVQFMSRMTNVELDLTQLEKVA